MGSESSALRSRLADAPPARLRPEVTPLHPIPMEPLAEVAAPTAPLPIPPCMPLPIPPCMPLPVPPCMPLPIPLPGSLGQETWEREPRERMGVRLAWLRAA